MSDPVILYEPITKVILNEDIATTVVIEEPSTIIKTDAPQGVPWPPWGNYYHQQITPSITWAITHNLGFYPSVQIEDSAGDSVIPQKIIQNGTNQIILEFLGSMAGKAYLS